MKRPRRHRPSKRAIPHGVYRSDGHRLPAKVHAKPQSAERDPVRGAVTTGLTVREAGPVARIEQGPGTKACRGISDNGLVQPSPGLDDLDVHGCPDAPLPRPLSCPAMLPWLHYLKTPAQISSDYFSSGFWPPANRRRPELGLITSCMARTWPSTGQRCTVLQCRWRC